MLLEQGARVDAPNRSGVTPLMAASLFAQEGTVHALLSRCASMAVARAARLATHCCWAGWGDCALLG